MSFWGAALSPSLEGSLCWGRVGDGDSSLHQPLEKLRRIGAQGLGAVSCSGVGAADAQPLVDAQGPASGRFVGKVISRPGPGGWGSEARGPLPLRAQCWGAGGQGGLRKGAKRG